MIYDLTIEIIIVIYNKADLNGESRRPRLHLHVEDGAARETVAGWQQVHGLCQHAEGQLYSIM